MRIKLKHLLLTIPFLVSSACSKSGTKALDKGDYYNAVLQSVEKLKKDIDNDKSLAVLPEAYNNAAKELLSDISIAKNADQQFKWERVLEDYSKLNKMHDLIAKCTACRRVVSPKSFFKETEQARDLAATERYIYASEMLKKGTIESGRASFDAFEKLFLFAPNYKDTREKMDEALHLGSYHVVVEQPSVNSRTYALSHQYFQDRIDEFLKENKRINKFIRFYSPSEAGSLHLKPDHVIRLEFVDFVVGETYLERKESTLTSVDSVKTGTAKIKGETVDVYGKVNAKYSFNKKIVSSKGLLLMEITDFNNKTILKKEEFPGEFIWVNEWSSYNGDHRALTEKELALTKNREELPPAPQQLFIEFSKPIYEQFTRRVKMFYDNY